MGTNEKKAPRKWGVSPYLWGVILIALLVVIVVGTLLSSLKPDPWQWSLNRSKYEEIVRRIEEASVRPGEERSYLISADKDPETLRPAGDLQEYPDLYEKLVRGQVIRVRRFQDGRLRVWIKMPGRRPTYGVVYSSGEPEKDELEYSFGSGSMVHALAEQWWAIEDRSD